MPVRVIVPAGGPVVVDVSVDLLPFTENACNHGGCQHVLRRPFAFDFAVLQQVTHHDEQQLLTLMKEFIGAQLVVEESAEQFAFRHAMTQQAVYTQLLVRERRVLHRMIGEAMEQFSSTTLDTHLADLAYHFSESDAWEKALEYAQKW